MKPLRRIVVAGFALFFAAPAGAAPEATLLPAQSEIVFGVTQMGVLIEGRFKRFDARIAFEPQRPEDGKVAIGIDVGSATMGFAEADAELAKPTWLASKSHPRATFQSTSIRSVGAGRFEVAGKLALKGIERDIVVPLTIAPPGAGGAASVASGAFVVDRLAFGIGEKEWADPSLVSHKVQVRFKLSLLGMGAP